MTKELIEQLQQAIDTKQREIAELEKIKGKANCEYLNNQAKKLFPSSYGVSAELKVTIDVGNVLKYFLIGWRPPADAEGQDYIGISTLAYISENDPAHVFLPAAVGHDNAYQADSWQVKAGLGRWIPDMIFLTDMLAIAKTDIVLIKEAIGLYLIVRKYGGDRYPGPEA